LLVSSHLEADDGVVSRVQLINVVLQP